ncbi:hypothetical protein ACKKBF_B18525 [Auxenochlorella protothecoides x Auxenochlorella symbiontica]
MSQLCSVTSTASPRGCRVETEACSTSSRTHALSHRPCRSSAAGLYSTTRKIKHGVRREAERGPIEPHRLAGAELAPDCVPIQAPTPCARSGRWLAQGAVAGMASLIIPSGQALAAGAGFVPSGLLESVLHTTESLGPLGPLAFVTVMSCAECIPLFPTQPLLLASGLLFGTRTGALCILAANFLAGTATFFIARGVGRPWAERLMGADTTSPLAQRAQQLRAVIERGRFWQQAGTILLLRMTPIVPFSASNYMLGLTPLPYTPYALGSAPALVFWAFFYASLGGASRSLLRRGVSPDVLFADLLERAAGFSGDAGRVALGLGLAGGVFLLVASVRRKAAASKGSLGPGQQAAPPEAVASAMRSSDEAL